LNNARLTICKLCEIFMDKFDYPWRLSKQLEIARARMKEAAGKANITAG
jgi:pyruvate decarboxylase